MEKFIDLASGIDKFINFFTSEFGDTTNAISSYVNDNIDVLINLFQSVPLFILIVLFTLIALYLISVRMAIFTFFGLFFIAGLGLWNETIATLVLMLVSTLVSILVGIPLGVMSALNNRVASIVSPVLDVMQTMPAFVYLIPAIPFFGLGSVSAIFSTVIFSIPPVIRMTSLGIRQVDQNLIEVADAYGATAFQKLIKVQIPIATVNILAGVNQTIMLALSMVVVAAMIGANGLGVEVWNAIQTLEAGHAFEAGISIVIIAVILDRISHSLGTEKFIERRVNINKSIKSLFKKQKIVH